MKPWSWLLIDKHANGKTTDVWLARRRILRLTNRQAGIIYGPLTLLRATKGGGTVKRSADRWTSLRTICGALVCTRWGSVMLQFRGFDTESKR